MKGMTLTDGRRPFISALGRLLSPSRCLACDEPTPRAFCPPCEASLVSTATTPLSGVGPVVAGGAFGGALADAIRRSKYHQRSDVARGLARWWMDEAQRELPASTALLVPVPLHPARLVERGFNQATLLARALAARQRRNIAPRALRRVRWTTPQAALGGAARRDNLNQAFVARRSLRGARVCIVDDVVTTGATLRASAEACVRAGGQVVGAVVIAASLTPP